MRFLFRSSYCYGHDVGGESCAFVRYDRFRVVHVMVNICIRAFTAGFVSGQVAREVIARRENVHIPV